MRSSRARRSAERAVAFARFAAQDGRLGLPELFTSPLAELNGPERRLASVRIDPEEFCRSRELAAYHLSEPECSTALLNSAALCRTSLACYRTPA